MEKSIINSTKLDNKNRLVISIQSLSDYIDNIVINRGWCKISNYNIDSDKHTKCKSVSQGYSTYSILYHNIYQMPDKKQGFILVKLSGQDDDNFNTNKANDNNFKIKLEIIMYYTRDKYIDRKFKEPENWSYMGGYSMDVVREIYSSNIEIDPDLKNITSLKLIELIKYFEEIKEYIPYGPIKHMRLHTLIPDKYAWPELDVDYWNKVGKQINIMISEGSGLFSSLKDDITLGDFLKTHKFSLNLMQYN